MEICLISLVFYLSDDYYFIDDCFAFIIKLSGTNTHFDYEFNFGSNYGVFLYSIH